MYDLVVLGGGSGGLNAATAAARIGAKVLLVEKGKLGGECTHSACVPSKALIQAARLAHQFRSASEYGLRCGKVEVDFAAVMARVRSVVAGFAGSDSGDGLRAKGVEVIHGSPVFESYDTIVIDGQTRVSANRFVIATGSRPEIPKIPGLAASGYLDNQSIWGLDKLPDSMVIIGAGPVGLEFGQAFARFGTNVTILTDGVRILPGEDPEVSEELQARLASEGIKFHTGVKVTGVAVKDGRKVCDFHIIGDTEKHQVAGAQLLVATGRLANIEGLNLGAAGIHADPEHGIEVDDYLQTRTRHILAIGDVLAHDRYTHAAERQAAIAVQNAVIRLPKRMDYSAMPRVTFTDPEVASVGITDELNVQEDNSIHRTYRASFEDLDRARIDGRTNGFAKVLATSSGKILGAVVVGQDASAILQEFVVAMEHGLTLTDLAGTVHPYPTYSGMVRKLANQFVAARLEGGLVQSALRWIYGYKPRNGATPVAGGPVAVESTGHANGHGVGH